MPTIKLRFIRPGPNGEKPGKVVEARVEKLNGYLTKTQRFIHKWYVEEIK